MKVAIAGTEKNVKYYIAALEGVGLEPVVTTDLTDSEGFAGLLLPGGGDIDPALFGEENRGSREVDRALDEKQLYMTGLFVRAKKPILGICKGHQVINVYFGGSVIQDLATAPAHQYHGEDNIHPCVSLENTLLRRLYGPRYVTNSAHHQGLARIGEGLRVTSFAADGAVESIAHETLPILGLQWHPERMCFARARPDTVDGEPVFRYFQSLMDRG